MATALSKIGVPLASTPTAICSRSSRDSIYPRPLTMNSVSPISTSLPPTSLLDLWIAFLTDWIDRLYARRRLGSISTWYCFTNPPMLATSDTPGTEVSSYRRYQSWMERICWRSCFPLVSLRTYSYTQPTPVASGPRPGVTPWGSRPETTLRYSSTLDLAQYRSVPSSKII